MTAQEISSEEFDRMFDDDEDVSAFVDFSQARLVPPRQVARRISMDMPEGMVAGLDKAARRLGVNRQAVIKFACDRFLDEERAKHADPIPA